MSGQTIVTSNISRPLGRSIDARPDRVPNSKITTSKSSTRQEPPKLSLMSCHEEEITITAHTTMRTRSYYLTWSLFNGSRRLKIFKTVSDRAPNMTQSLLNPYPFWDQETPHCKKTLPIGKRRTVSYTTKNSFIFPTTSVFDKKWCKFTMTFPLQDIEDNFPRLSPSNENSGGKAWLNSCAITSRAALHAKPQRTKPTVLLFP